FVPEKALQLEDRHHAEAAIDVQKGAFEVTRIFAQAPKQGRVSLSRLVRRAQLPLTPVVAPERLHLRVIRSVQLAGSGEERLQRPLPVAAQQVAGDEPLTVL